MRRYLVFGNQAGDSEDLLPSYCQKTCVNMHFAPVRDLLKRKILNLLEP